MSSGSAISLPNREGFKGEFIYLASYHPFSDQHCRLGRSSSKLDPAELFPHYNLPNFLRAPADVIRRGILYFPQAAVAVGHPDCSRPVRLSRGDVFSFIADHHGFFGFQLPGFQNEFNQVRLVIELSV